MSAATSMASPTPDFAAAIAALALAVDDVRARGDFESAQESDIGIGLAALARLFAAKSERTSGPMSAVAPDALTATETVTLVSALLRAADLNVFDLAMWFRRAS